MNLPWYISVPADSPLDQGDIIFDCPVVSWKDEPIAIAENGEESGVLKSRVELSTADVVVMTQTCDLAEQKVHYVILCPHFDLAEYRKSWEDAERNRSQTPTDKSWGKFLDRVAAGQSWNLSLLNREQRNDLKAPHRIVDFHEVLSLPRDFLESWLMRKGSARLRLCPPYREHLSQAFARFFMRVGLPSGIEKCW